MVPPVCRLISHIISLVLSCSSYSHGRFPIPAIALNVVPSSRYKYLLSFESLLALSCCTSHRFPLFEILHSLPFSLHEVHLQTRKFHSESFRYSHKLSQKSADYSSLLLLPDKYKSPENTSVSQAFEMPLRYVLSHWRKLVRVSERLRMKLTCLKMHFMQ